MQAVPLLMSVVGLLVFYVFLYAVAGTQMFMGAFHDKCATNESIDNLTAQGIDPTLGYLGAGRGVWGFRVQGLATRGSGFV